MPLCPQITNTPVTVTQTGDFVVTSVVPLIADNRDGLAGNISDIDADAAAAQAAANDAAAAAGVAQADATEALADAAIAYTAAIGSLQPSANTIVNAQNQMTAINGTGITVFSGASSTSGARVVLNSLGLAAYGATSSVNITAVSGNGTNVTYTASGHSFTVGQSITVSELAPAGYNGSFVITSVVASTSFTVANTTTAAVTDANGVAERATLAISATTGNAVFSGSVTGSTIIGGTLNIAGKTIIDGAGLLTGTGVTLTGRINAEAGYFGTPTNGFDISTTGLVGVGNGVISGGTISGTTFTNGSTFSVTSAGVLTATSGTIGGFTFTSTGFTVGAIGVSINTNGNATFATVTTNTNQNNVFGGPIKALDGIETTGNISATSGVTVTGAPIYTGDATTTASTETAGISLTQGGTISARRSNNNPLNLHIFGVTAGTGTSVPVIQFIRNGTNRGTLEVFGNTTAPTLVGSSDYRLKENIRDYTESLDKLLATKVRVFNEVEDAEHSDVIGFVAHEFAEVFPNMVNGQKDAVDVEGNPIYQKLGYTNLIPHLVGAIQALHKEIELLKGE
jgi:hypothetical protein